MIYVDCDWNHIDNMFLILINIYCVTLLLQVCKRDTGLYYSNNVFSWKDTIFDKGCTLILLYIVFLNGYHVSHFKTNKYGYLNKTFTRNGGHSHQHQQCTQEETHFVDQTQIDTFIIKNTIL